LGKTYSTCGNGAWPSKRTVIAVCVGQSQDVSKKVEVFEDVSRNVGDQLPIDTPPTASQKSKSLKAVLSSMFLISNVFQVTHKNSARSRT